MRILVAAKRLAADRTSEGICSSKYVAALVAAGHDVRCLTGERLPQAQAAWHEAHAPIESIDGGVRSSRVESCAHWSQRLSTGGAAGALASRKLNGATARATGYALTTWAEAARWRRAIGASVGRWHPDAIVVRGAGREFEPHIAMLGWRVGVPWVAHYHDPYPASLYPEPYRQYVPLQSPRQEDVHRHIVVAADALTFPSRRLLEWVLRDDLQSARGKAFVVPHIAGGKVFGDVATADEVAIEPDRLNLVHAGTLLRERDPRPLLGGVLRFVADNPERQDAIRLIFIGRVDPAHSALPEWRALRDCGLLRSIETRVSYRAAMTACAAADCMVILEAHAAESPFFPAKLADCLAIGRPILAVTPDRSVTSDILGDAYPLRVPTGRVEGIVRALDRLWSAWIGRDLGSLVPPPAAAFSEGAIGRATAAVLNHVIDTRKGRAA